MEKANFKFSPEFVVGLSGLQVINSGNNNEIRTECPHCKKSNAYLNKTKYAYHCFSCGAKGGILEYYQTAKGLDSKKEAFNELNNAYEQLPPDKKDEMEALVGVRDKSNSQNVLASPKKIDKAYTNLLKGYSLSKFDKQELLRRGLTEKDIKKLEYITVPNSIGATKRMFGKALIPYSKKCVAIGKSNIPGLYLKNGVLVMAKQPTGIMIPVRARDGKINMFQIRRHALPKSATKEEKKKYHKYIQFSSGFKDTGCSTAGITKIHHAGFNYESEENPITVCITEGCLKADVASCLDNKAYIAVLGVSNLNNLDKEIKQLIENGTRKFRIRLDMDFIDNPAVAEAIIKLNKMFNDRHIPVVLAEPHKNSPAYICYETLAMKLKENKINFLPDTKNIPQGRLVVYNDVWNPKYKGIDDYLLSIKNR